MAKERRYRRDGAYYVVSPVDVVESPQFFAWLCGFGADAQLLAPASAAEQMKAYIEEIAALYRGDAKKFLLFPIHRGILQLITRGRSAALPGRTEGEL